jgi:cell pole-organizing protein PopZ
MSASSQKKDVGNQENKNLLEKIRNRLQREINYNSVATSEERLTNKPIEAIERQSKTGSETPIAQVQSRIQNIQEQEEEYVFEDELSDSADFNEAESEARESQNDNILKYEDISEGVKSKAYNKASSHVRELREALKKQHQAQEYRHEDSKENLFDYIGTLQMSKDSPLTLQEIVLDVTGTMLQKWLDQNIERIVREMVATAIQDVISNSDKK